MKIIFGIIGPSVACVAALVVFFAVLTDKKIPMISGDRPAFIALAIINFFMCLVGPLPWTKPGGWLSPFNIALYMLGFCALLLIVVVISAKTVPIPFVSTYRTAYFILFIIIFVKWALSSVQYMLSVTPL